MGKPSEEDLNARRWDEKTQVLVSADVPLKRITFLVGEPTARIVFDYDCFMTAYRKEADWIYEHALPEQRDGFHYRDLIKAIQVEGISSDEIDIYTVAAETNGPLDFCFNRALFPALDKGQVCLYDVENRCYVDFYILRKYGYTFGRLEGKAHLEYLLPSGKVFIKLDFVS